MRSRMLRGKVFSAVFLQAACHVYAVHSFRAKQVLRSVNYGGVIFYIRTLWASEP